MEATGYSGTPLAKKLGIKSGFHIRLVNEPDYYFSLFADMPGNVMIHTEKKPKKNMIHYFTTQARVLQMDMISLKNEIE